MLSYFESFAPNPPPRRMGWGRGLIKNIDFLDSSRNVSDIWHFKVDPTALICALINGTIALAEICYLEELYIYRNIKNLLGGSTFFEYFEA